MFCKWEMCMCHKFVIATPFSGGKTAAEMMCTQTHESVPKREF